MDLKKLKGKTVVLDFWATWCGPCKASFPAMQKMIDKYSTNDKVVFFFINTKESLTQEKRIKEITEYLTDHKFRFNVLLDTKKDPTLTDSDATTNLYKVDGIPTKIVIGPDSKINFVDIGYSGSVERLMIDLSAMIDATL